MLDERKGSILRAVVEEYIETALPVGSSHVVKAAGVAVSSATVRNEMAVLEREGYLVQPHTSAGRIPTDKGYRFFVDHLAPPGNLPPAQRQLVRNFFNSAHGELEQMLHDTSRLLSILTDYAAVVAIGPAPEQATVRSVQLVALTDRVALLVVVLSNGAVEKRTLELGDHADDVRLGAATSHLATHLAGRTLADLEGVPPTGDTSTDAIVRAALSSLTGGHHPEAEHVFVGGASRMAAAFDAVETVRQVLTTLEQQYVVVTLLQDVIDRGLTVAIGTETGLDQLAECALVVAPYEVEGSSSGTIGVLGPTRMKYSQALAAVTVVSNRLGRRLREG